MDPTVIAILREAAQFKETVGRTVTYSDYERYKTQLHSAGCYGYEDQLAAVLEL